MEALFTLTRPDGEQLACYRWSNGALPRAVLVVAHGMGEHARRYRPALAQLVDSGVALYALDHRGHGATITLNGREAGDFGPGGFDAVVEDLAALVARARSENPDLPLFLLGHSMGSFIGQAFLIEHGDRIDGAVLVGTTDVELLAQGMASEPDVLAALNRPFEPARTPCDWLSRDEVQVDLYLNDPLCGFSLVPDSMVSLLSQGARLSDPAQIARIPRSLPLYVLVGGRDVLTTAFGKLEPLVKRYRAAGLDPVVALYPEGRHEILNETNRDEVVTALKAWLDAAFQTARTSVRI
ncbi:lysophospholipase [Caulobacter sp. AP07]|uniref:alpha/beta fold hydrolase n=1 Tax=Caulobacter sp. AP07 TaxID=1144304 RepID=UPI000271DA4B|nr:alpha/beta fold hydrolase [Caulobacter sp. AP07]EJL26602.1 lysophospholipase [Caulobacter sp. AP07]